MDLAFTLSGFLLNLVITTIGLVNVLEPRFGKWKTALLFIGMGAAAIFCCIPIIYDTLTRFPVMLAVMVAGACLLFRDKLIKRIGVLFLFLLIEMLSEVLMMAVLSASQGILDIELAATSAYSTQGLGIVMRGGYTCVQGLLVLLTVTLWKRRTGVKTDNSLGIIATYVMVQGFMTAEAFSYLLMSGDTYSPFFMISILFVNVGSLVFALLFARYYRKQTVQDAETAMLQEQFAERQQSYNEMRAQFEQVRRDRHDLNNHIVILQGLLEEGQEESLTEYLGNLIREARGEAGKATEVR